jgi:hypothetical protein
MAISKTLSLGQGRVLLRCPNADGSIRCLGFIQRARRIEVWETLDEDSAPPRRVGSFVGELDALRVAHWLSSRRDGPALELAQAALSVVEGLDEDGEWDSLVLNAWTSEFARTEPGLAAVLRLTPDALDAVEERFGALDPNLVAELASTVLQGNREWLAKWRTDVDAEVARRLAAEGTSDDGRRRAPLRDFVECCVLRLGRLPLSEETELAWGGRDVPLDELSLHKRRKLGLTWTGRVRRFRVRFDYWSAAETFGYSDLNAGPGWYFTVQNPDPSWMICSTEGPYRTDDEAWEDAQCIGQEN